MQAGLLTRPLACSRPCYEVSLTPDHHADACRLILVLALSVLGFDGGVKFPQLLSQTFCVGNDSGQTVQAFPLHQFAPR